MASHNMQPVDNCAASVIVALAIPTYPMPFP